MFQPCEDFATHVSWLTLSASHIPYMRSLFSTYSCICLLGLPLGVTVVCLIIWSFSLLHSEAMLTDGSNGQYRATGMNVQLGGGLYVHFTLTNACYKLGHIYKKQTKCYCSKTNVNFSQMKWLGRDFSADLMHITKRCVFSLKLLCQAFSSTTHR